MASSGHNSQSKLLGAIQIRAVNFSKLREVWNDQPTTAKDIESKAVTADPQEFYTNRMPSMHCRSGTKTDLLSEELTIWIIWTALGPKLSKTTPKLII